MWTLSKIINIIRISWKNSPPTNKSEESFGRGTFLLTHTDDGNDDNDDDGDDDDDDDRLMGEKKMSLSYFHLRHPL